MMEHIKKDIALLNIEQYMQLRPVLSQIISPYAVIKGEALSLLCYNKKSVRRSQDIDVLIERNNLSIIEKVLINNGFEVLSKSSKTINRENRIIYLSQSHQIEPYIKETKNHYVQIDLNFDIFWGEYTSKRVDMNEFLSDTIEMEIYGAKVKSLPPLKAMIQLILHHFKDMNSIYLLSTRKSIKFDMFKDVYYLLKNNYEAISLDKLYTISEKYEIIPYVYYILYYTGMLFDDDLLKKYVTAFQTHEGEELLNCYGLNESERRKWKCDFKTRLESESTYDLIKEFLTDKDKEKIEINRKVFLGE